MNSELPTTEPGKFLAFIRAKGLTLTEENILNELFEILAECGDEKLESLQNFIKNSDVPKKERAKLKAATIEWIQNQEDQIIPQLKIF